MFSDVRKYIVERIIEAYQISQFYLVHLNTVIAGCHSDIFLVKTKITYEMKIRKKNFMDHR